MAFLNKLYCAGNTGNVGTPTCIHSPGKAVGVIQIPKGKIFSPSEILALQATLEALAKDDDRSKRIFPIGRFVDIDDKSTEAQTQKFGYGGEVETSTGQYNVFFQHVNGIGYHMQLQNFVGAHNKFELLLVDENWVIVGTKKKLSTGEWGMGGLSLSQIKVPNFKLATGSKVTDFWIGYSLADARQLNKNYAFVQCDFDPLDAMVPLLDVILDNLTTMALPVAQIKVSALSGWGSTNFTDMYSAQLTAAQFVVKNALTQLAIPVTAAQVDASGATLTLDSASPNYPAIGGQMTVTLVKPSQLATANMEGYEANTVVVTRLK